MNNKRMKTKKDLKNDVEKKKSLPREKSLRFWTDNCPFHNGNIKSHIAEVDPLSAEFCSLT